MIGGRIQVASYGIYTDRDALVVLAEEAFATAPSLGSRWGVQQALLVRAEHRLKRADPDLNVLDDRFHRSTSPEELIAAVLSTDGRLKELVLKDADVKRALESAPRVLLRQPNLQFQRPLLEPAPEPLSQRGGGDGEDPDRQ